MAHLWRRKYFGLTEDRRLLLCWEGILLFWVHILWWYYLRGSWGVFSIYGFPSQNSLCLLSLVMCLCDWCTCFARCEDGVGMEGIGAWEYGPRRNPKCAHHTCFTNEWVIKILLHITHAGQCLFIGVHDKLLGSWFRDVWPTGWDFGNYFQGHIFHCWPVTMRSTDQLRGHWQGRWSFKCPELHWCVLHTWYPEERELHPYCTYPWSYTIGTDQHHSEGCRILIITFSYTEPNEIGDGLYTGCPVRLVSRICSNYEKTTLWL